MHLAPSGGKEHFSGGREAANMKSGGSFELPEGLPARFVNPEKGFVLQITTFYSLPSE